MRILFLSRWFPYPPDNGSKIRIFNILKQLSQQHDIALIAFAESSDRVTAETIEALRVYCSEVIVFPYRHFRPSSARAVLGLSSPVPRSLADTHSEAMAASIRERVTQKRCDLIIASQLDMAPYARATPNIPAILEELELAVYRDSLDGNRPMASRVRATMTWLKLSGYVKRIIPRFAACTVASQQEAKLLLRLVPAYTGVKVIPNAVDLSDYKGNFGAPVPRTMLFAGAMTYSANFDAVRYFLADIYPIIEGAEPGNLLRVTGRTAGVDLTTLPSHAGVEFTGYVDDIRPLMAKSWLSVVPLRVGGGTRLKILESMALGTPVVSTSKGAEGLDVIDGESIAIGKTSKQFAERVSEILGSPTLRSRLSNGGRDLTQRKYDWSKVGGELRNLASQVLSEGVAA